MQIKKPIKTLRCLTILLLSLLHIENSYGASNCSASEVDKIEQYLNSFSKAAIKFNQYSFNKNIREESKGVLLISKPGNFRVNYDSPHPLIIVGGKKFVSIYDYDLDELSRIDAADNIFKFLLELNLKIQDSVKIESCRQDNKSILLNLTHKETEQKAKLLFKLAPISLHKLVILNDESELSNSAVEINFQDIIQASSINDELFILKDNRIYGVPKKYSSEEILKTIKLK